VAIFLAGGILGGWYWKVLKKEREGMKEMEIPIGWKSYKNEEVGISFYYPSTWGEVIDFMENYANSWKEMEKNEKELKIWREQILSLLEKLKKERNISCIL